MTIPRVDEPILANGAGVGRWGVYNKHIYSVLLLLTEGAANSFLVYFAGSPDSRQQSDGQAAWQAMTDKKPKLVNAAAAYSNAQIERPGHDNI